MMNNGLYKLIFILLSLTLLFSFSVKKVQASCIGLNGTSSTQTDAVFCSNNSGTIWEIVGIYREVDTFQNIPIDVWTDSTSVDPSCQNYGVQTINNYKATSNDTVTWHSACVDPTSPVHPTLLDQCLFGGNTIYQAEFDVTCSSNSLYGNPASCSQPNNWGTVSADGWCPSGPYCMYGGNTDAVSCQGAFNQPQIKGTAPSSCGYGGTCNYSYCTTTNGLSTDGIPITYGTCNNTTDTTGGLCGSTCIAPTTYGCVNNACAVVSGGSFTESTCGGTCATPPPTIGCSTAPTYAPPPPNPNPNGPNKFPQTVALTTGSCVDGTTCSVACSWTCTDSQNKTCAANPCSTVWACQGGTTWFNDGTYYATCPNQCQFCKPGDKIINCSIANACSLP